MKREILRKYKYLATVLLLGIFFLLSSGTTVRAAGNPLAGMPTKDTRLIALRTGYGEDFITGDYSSKVKISVKSSNPKVVKVKGTAYRNSSEGKPKYYAGYSITPVSPGKAKITVTVTVNKKKYTKTCVYTIYKWENPFKVLKAGNLNCQPLFQKTNYCRLKRKTLSGKFTYKLKQDFTLVSATAMYYPNPKNKYMVKTVRLKNGQMLPKNTVDISIRAKSKKTKYDRYIMILDTSWM